MKSYRKSSRKEFHNYNFPGIYFVTVCTRNKQEKFGIIKDKLMKLNKAGTIVDDVIKESCNHFKYVQVLSYIVMPNHIHILIEIQAPYINKKGKFILDESEVVKYPYEDIEPNYKRQHQKLFVIVGQIKSSATKLIRKHSDENFMWQEGFYDSYVSNPENLREVEDYIITNPAKWEEDRFHTK